MYVYMDMYVCVGLIFLCVYIYKYIYNIRTHTYMCTSIYMCVFVYMYMSYSCMFKYVSYICTIIKHTHTHVHIYICVCVCVCDRASKYYEHASLLNLLNMVINIGLQ
jgi:hypothetical protein